ncbi:hypothetical protein C8J57DRAFT_1212381 [Mycena rebaudengoi]|nr:hypothetical protein C8J57DRAFT_1212381 [Mycena rebaudengoi]
MTVRPPQSTGAVATEHWCDAGAPRPCAAKVVWRCDAEAVIGVLSGDAPWRRCNVPRRCSKAGACRGARDDAWRPRLRVGGTDMRRHVWGFGSDDAGVRDDDDADVRAVAPLVHAHLRAEFTKLRSESAWGVWRCMLAGGDWGRAQSCASGVLLPSSGSSVKAAQPRRGGLAGNWAISVCGVDVHDSSNNTLLTVQYNSYVLHVLHYFKGHRSVS